MANIKQVILKTKQEFKSPGYIINSGLCEDFALRVIDRLGGYSNELTDGAPDDIDCELPGHYWIEYQGRYYDAECSSGVTDWRNLPIFRRYSRVS